MQTMEKDQTNTIFDFIMCNNSNSFASSACSACYAQNFNYLNARYLKNEPCLQYVCHHAGSATTSATRASR